MSIGAAKLQALRANFPLAFLIAGYIPLSGEISHGDMKGFAGIFCFCRGALSLMTKQYFVDHICKPAAVSPVSGPVFAGRVTAVCQDCRQ
jgi:hypothetical protein